MTDHIPTREELMYGDKTAALEAELAREHAEMHRYHKLFREAREERDALVAGGEAKNRHFAAELARLERKADTMNAWAKDFKRERDEAREERDALVAGGEAKNRHFTAELARLKVEHSEWERVVAERDEAREENGLLRRSVKVLADDLALTEEDRAPLLPGNALEAAAELAAILTEDEKDAFVATLTKQRNVDSVIPAFADERHEWPPGFDPLTPQPTEGEAT